MCISMRSLRAWWRLDTLWLDMCASLTFPEQIIDTWDPLLHREGKELARTIVNQYIYSMKVSQHSPAGTTLDQAPVRAGGECTVWVSPQSLPLYKAIRTPQPQPSIAVSCWIKSSIW